MLYARNLFRKRVLKEQKDILSIIPGLKSFVLRFTDFYRAPLSRVASRVTSKGLNGNREEVSHHDKCDTSLFQFWEFPSPF